MADLTRRAVTARGEASLLIDIGPGVERTRLVTDFIPVTDIRTQQIIPGGPGGDVESFPDSGQVDRTFSPGATQSQIDQIQAGENVEFLPGDYGDRHLNRLSQVSGVYAFCRATLADDGLFGYQWTASPAEFHHVHQGVCYDDPFCWGMDPNNTLRGMLIDGFSPNPKSGTDYRGAGVLRPTGNNCTYMDLEIQRSRESAFYPTADNVTIKRVAAYLMGKYMWGGGVGDDGRIFNIWCHEVYTSPVISAGLVPAQVSSDRGVCKNPGGVDGLQVDGAVYWNIDGKGVWWDGAGTNGVCRNVRARNVDHNVVSAEVSLGPFLFEDIYAEDSARTRSSATDVISATVLWPLTPDVTVRRVTSVRCGNGVTTHNRDHPVLDVGAGGYSAQYMRDNLGVRNSIVEDCDFTDIKGGAGEFANRYNAGWAGGGFTHSPSGDVIQFEAPVWRNNIYSPSPSFRVGGPVIGLSEWTSTYGMS